MMDNKYEKENFIKIVKESINLSDVCRKIGLKPYYGNRQTIKKYINQYKIDTSHFKFGKSNINNFNKKKIEDILVKNLTYSTTHLKYRLYKEGLKERKCEICGQGEEWYGMVISLILDHINGINTDNRIENLRIVCPNYNAGLDTHGGKNIGKSYKYNYVSKNKYYCCDCGCEKSKKSKRCKKCNDIFQRKVKRPNKETLLKDVNELGYTGTGKKYGVTCNSIRKWLKK